MTKLEQALLRAIQQLRANGGTFTSKGGAGPDDETIARMFAATVLEEGVEGLSQSVAEYLLAEADKQPTIRGTHWKM